MGYNLQCNVIDNLLITNVVSSQQYHCNMNDPKQKKEVTKRELFEGGSTTCNVLGDQRTDPS